MGLFEQDSHALTRDDRKVIARLEWRFPGLLDTTRRVALQMAVQVTGQARVRHRIEARGAGYAAFVEGFSLQLHGGHRPVVFPVVPDEVNPNADGKVTQEMPPHVFARHQECEAAAEQAASVLLSQLRALERGVSAGGGQCP